MEWITVLSSKTASIQAGARLAFTWMKVLVVEDERKIASLMQKALETAGFVVDVSNDGQEALVLATTRAYDALVCDIMVPGRDGLSVLRELRTQRNPLPVLLVSARGSLQERVEGLNLGADDYLPKPFYSEELIARLHAVLRRRSGSPQSIMESGDLRVNLLTREVWRGTARVELTTREFALLTYLMRSPGRVLTRTQICEHVWNYQFDPGSNLVDVYVQRVRKKIADDAKAPRIETVRGVGYRFSAT